MAYHWNEEAAEIARLGPLADAIELAGVADLGDAFERVDDGTADLWSVYLHFPCPADESDPEALMGALCIADRDTPAAARGRAAALAKRFGLPINDFS